MSRRILILVAVIVAFEMVNYIPSEEATLKSVNTLIKEFNLFQVQPAGADVVLSDREAIDIIAMEGSYNADYRELLGIACAIRNSIKAGIRPIHRYFITTDSNIDNAIKAWNTSAKEDITAGALYWDNIEAFNIVEWHKDKVVTAILGKRVFYRIR